MKNELTEKEALENIGVALAHDSLRLSQKEHLSIIKSYNIVCKQVDDLIEENKILKIKINDLELNKNNE